MHVCILGAGALGRVYGVRLALRGGVGVSFVVRPDADGGAMRISRVDAETDSLAEPVRVTEVPGDADIVLVCVRTEQLDDALLAMLDDGPHVPAVVMTSILPADYARLRERLGDRMVAAMPGVTAYAREDGTTRYWLPHAATTLIEEPRGDADAAIGALVEALGRAGIGARLEMGVHEQGPATTIAFLPMVLGIDIAGGVDALLADDALLALTLRATDEATAMARTIGSVAPWAGLLLKFAGALTLKVGVALGRKRSPEAFRYVEAHFGRRAHTQNVALARQALALAEAIAAERGAAREAFAELVARINAEGGVLASS